MDSSGPAPSTHFIRFRLHASHEEVKAASPGGTGLVAEYVCGGETCDWTTGPLQGGERIVHEGPDAGLRHEVEHGTRRQLLGRRVVQLHRGEYRSGAGIGGDTLYWVPDLGWVGNYRPTFKNGNYRGKSMRWTAAVNPSGRDGNASSSAREFTSAAAAMRWLLTQASSAAA